MSPMMRIFFLPAYGSGNLSSGRGAAANVTNGTAAVSSSTNAAAEPSCLRQCEDVDLIASDRTFEKTASRGDDCNILLSILTLIRDWRCMRGRCQLDGPQLISRLRIESPEPGIVGCSNKHEATGRSNRSAHIGPSGFGHIVRQLVADPQRALPDDLCSLHVDGSQCAPGRLLAHQTVLP